VIEKRQRRGRDGRTYWVYRVRWHDANGAERNKTLPRGSTRRDAEAFERRVYTLKRTGELDVLDRGCGTLAEFAEEWWELYARANLARATLVRCDEVWRTHTRPRLGHVSLRELTPELVTRFRLDLERAGAGEATVRKALSMLQGWDDVRERTLRIYAPKTRRERAVDLLSPLRSDLAEWRLACGRPAAGRSSSPTLAALGLTTMSATGVDESGSRHARAASSTRRWSPTTCVTRLHRS
jgi:hypothetical protein